MLLRAMAATSAPTADYLALYARAFEEFGAMALWNSRRLEAPSAADALAVALALRAEGNRSARALAEDLERAARRAAD
jgi:hypothetical protein